MASMSLTIQVKITLRPRLTAFAFALATAGVSYSIVSHDRAGKALAWFVVKFCVRYQVVELPEVAA